MRVFHNSSVAAFSPAVPDAAFGLHLMTIPWVISDVLCNVNTSYHRPTCPFDCATEFCISCSLFLIAEGHRRAQSQRVFASLGFWAFVWPQGEVSAVKLMSASKLTSILQRSFMQACIHYLVHIITSVSSLGKVHLSRKMWLFVFCNYSVAQCDSGKFSQYAFRQEVRMVCKHFSERHVANVFVHNIRCRLWIWNQDHF